MWKFKLRYRNDIDFCFFPSFIYLFLPHPSQVIRLSPTFTQHHVPFLCSCLLIWLFLCGFTLYPKYEAINLYEIIWHQIKEKGDVQNFDFNCGVQPWEYYDQRKQCQGTTRQLQLPRKRLGDKVQAFQWDMSYVSKSHSSYGFAIIRWYCTSLEQLITQVSQNYMQQVFSVRLVKYKILQRL
jgi:hypothetical protein